MTSALQSAASPSMGRHLGSVALVVASLGAVWLGVAAPDTSPVSAPQAATAPPAVNP